MDKQLMEEIGQYDREYAPAERTVMMPGVDALADGPHLLEVASAELTRTQKTNEPICRVLLRVLGGPQAGLVVEKGYLFRGQDSVDRLGADLLALGFDADKWSGRHGRRFSVELEKALPRLRGVRFQGKKNTSAKDGKAYLDVLFAVAAPAGAPPAPQAQQPAPSARPTGTARCPGRSSGMTPRSLSSAAPGRLGRCRRAGLPGPLLPAHDGGRRLAGQAARGRPAPRGVRPVRGVVLLLRRVEVPEEVQSCGSSKGVCSCGRCGLTRRRWMNSPGRSSPASPTRN